MQILVALIMTMNRLSRKLKELPFLQNAHTFQLKNGLENVHRKMCNKFLHKKSFEKRLSKKL